MAMGAHPEASLPQRTDESFEQKRAIARQEASVILSGEKIVLYADSSVGALAHELGAFDRFFLTMPGINSV